MRASLRLRDLVEPAPVETPAERLRVTLDLMETGIALMRQNLRRATPEASEEAIDAALLEWLVAPRP